MSANWTEPPTASIDQILAESAYEPVKRLGAGGMGEVFVVRAREFGRLFALKLLRPHLREAPDLVSRMRREARALGRLQHPNVVEIADFWIARDGRPCIVTELLEGRTLAQELRQRRRLPPHETVELACQALEALAAAHALGIVHRDLKPENLFLHYLPPDPKSTLKVLDFGVVGLLGGGSDGPGPTVRTKTGAVVGTPRFMSPEQARGERVDCRTDIYAIGMVLYVMLAGQGPYDGLAKHAAPPSAYVPGIPSSLDAIVLGAIQRNKEERYGSADALLRDLRATIPSGPTIPR
jgi:serine/threonine-protein kinase